MCSANVNSNRIRRIHFRGIGEFTGNMSIPTHLPFFTSVTSFGSPSSGRCMRILTSPNFGNFQAVMAKRRFYDWILANAYRLFFSIFGLWTKPLSYICEDSTSESGHAFCSEDTPFFAAFSLQRLRKAVKALSFLRSA